MSFLEGLRISALIFVVIALIIFGPFISIWSLNTLFGLTIAYTWKTWLAMCGIGLFFQGISSYND